MVYVEIGNKLNRKKLNHIKIIFYISYTLYQIIEKISTQFI